MRKAQSETQEVKEEKRLFTDTELATFDFVNVYQSSLATPHNCCQQYALSEMMDHIIRDELTNEPDLARLQLWLWPRTVIDSRLDSGKTRYRCRSTLRRRSSPEESIYQVVVDEHQGRKAGEEEYAIGKELNELRKDKVPNFLYTYCYFDAGNPIVWKDKVFMWFLKTKEPFERCNYYIMEDLGPNQDTLSSLLSSGKVVKFSNLMSLFFQCIYALNEAYDRFGFVHGHVCDSSILIRQAGPAKETLITYPKCRTAIQIFDSVIMWSNFHYSTTSTINQRAHIVYDIYYLVLLFVRETTPIMSTNPGVRQCIEYMTDLLYRIEIPSWYIVNIDKISCQICHKHSGQSGPKVVFPTKVETIRWEDIQNIIKELNVGYKLDNIVKMQYLRAWDDAMQKHQCSVDKVTKYRNYPGDEFITICYSQPATSYLDRLDEITDQHFDFISTLKRQLEAGYDPIISKQKLKLHEDAVSTHKEHDRHCGLIISLFIDMLKQKILLYELDSALYCTTSIKTEANIETQNLKNYINEHHSRLLRLVGECKELYDNSEYILPWEEWTLLKRIYYTVTAKKF